jgi:hypothetical protein
VVFDLGRRFFGRVAGVVAGALFTANFLQMILAQNARAYSLQLLLLTLSWLALFNALEGNRTRQWVAYVAATVLSIYTALFSGLVVIAQVVALALLLISPGPWQQLIRRSAANLALALASSFGLVLPIVVDAALHGGPTWVPPAHLSDLKAFLNLLDGNSRLYELLVFGMAAIGIALALATLWPKLRAYTRATPRQLGVVIALCSWFAVPIVVSFALTRPSLNLHLFFPRYLVISVAPLALLAGFGVSAMKLRAVQVVGAAALIVVAWPPLASYYSFAQVEDVRSPISWLQSHYQAGDGIVCAPDVQCEIPVAYYLTAYPGPAHLDSDSPGMFDWHTNTSYATSPQSVALYATRHNRIFVVYAPLGHGNALDPQPAALRAELEGIGYHLIGESDSHAVGTDTVVLLFQAK